MNAAGGTLTPEQKQFLQACTASPLKTARARLPAPLRRKALHPDLEATLTAIFACVMPAVMEARRAVVPPQWVTRTLGDSLRPSTPSATRVLSALQNGCDVLGVVRPALYPRKTSAPLTPSPAAPAMFVSLDACDAMSELALAFVVGKRLSELQPELAARAIFPTVTELTALRETAWRLAKGEPLPAEPNAAAFHKALREAMTKETLEPLRVAVSRAQARETSLDVATWLRLADASAARIGLLLAGSVEAARRAMILEAHSPGDLSPRERLNDLLAFAVSDTYSELREALRVAIR
jgi:hypothetical protein